MEYIKVIARTCRIRQWGCNKRSANVRHVSMTPLFLATARSLKQDNGMQVSPLLWIGLAAAVVVLLAAVWVFFRGASAKDLGTVSDHWIMEHRSGPD